MIEKTKRIIDLYDFYQSLLTDKQQDYITSYYEDDLSLAEVADKYGVSRNAVYDNLVRVERLLEDYESKLSLLEKHKKLSKITTKLRSKYEDPLIDELEDI